MNVDELFKAPKLQMSGSKRRLPDNPTPEMLKRMRSDVLTSPTASSIDAASGLSDITPRAPGLRDEEDEGAEGYFAPGSDADYFTEEDEEGRFYGGGLTKEQKDILNIFEKAGESIQGDPDQMTLPSIRRTLLRFERAVDKNQAQRSKHPDDPTKFIDSEADLDIALKALLPLAQSPQLSYPEIVKSEALTRLIGLLSHENADIVIDVVEVIHEFTDEDVGNEDEGSDQIEGLREESIKILMEGLLENSILELLVDNLHRLKEEEESDKQGVFHILGIFESIIGFDAKLSEQLVSKTKILPWLLERIHAKAHDENRGYAAELLSILLQDNQANRLALGKLNGIETLLQVLSQYRRRDPKDADDAEYMENLFDALCSALGEPEIKQQFLDCEGVDLMVLMMNSKMQSRSRSIKVLDYAMSGPTGTTTCETFVEALGLKSLFSVFMGKPPKKQKGTSVVPASEDTAHSLGIISSLFTNLPSESTARMRLLAKFVENNYEKVEKLLEVRDAAQTRLNTVEKEIAIEMTNEAEGEEVSHEEEHLWYLRRLDGGLFTLQTIDYILAWVAMEDDGIRLHIQKMLNRGSKSLRDIIKTLQILHDNIDEDETPDEMGMSRRDILRNLVAFLEAC